KKFSRDHEWVFVDGNIGTVGVTEHAQQTLGDIVFVELPEVGTDVSVGESCGVVESVKAVADVLSPVSGQVKEVNDALIEESSLVNDSPEAEGWIYRIELSDEKELDNLMDKDHYTKFCEEN
ncbi:glycine cleavage system H protein, partial [Chlamydoabsidia padenii]